MTTNYVHTVTSSKIYTINIFYKFNNSLAELRESMKYRKHTINRNQIMKPGKFIKPL